jgi:curved DNA-binding protein CbpA
MNKDDNPYEILGVEEDSSDSDIKKAYRKLALKHHPDKQTNEEDKVAANDIFCKLSQAYETLSDPVKKYDYRLAHGKKEKKATKATKTETTTANSANNVKTTTETSYEPPKPKAQTNKNYSYSSPSPTAAKPKTPASTPNSGSWSKVQPKNNQNQNQNSSTSAAPPKKKTSPTAPKKTADTGYSYIPPPGKSTEHVNTNTNVNTLPKKKGPVKSNNTSYSYVPPPGKSTENMAAPPKKGPVKTKKVDTSYNYVPPPSKSTEMFAPSSTTTSTPMKRKKSPVVKKQQPQDTAWSRAPPKKTNSAPQKMPVKKAVQRSSSNNNSNHKTVPSPQKTSNMHTLAPKKATAAKGETEYVWSRANPNTMETVTSSVNNKKAPTAPSRSKNPQFHDPFQIFDNVMKDEYGDGYKKSSSADGKSSGWSDPSTFSKANQKIVSPKKKKNVLGFFSGKNKTNDVVNMTMSTKTLLHDDGRIEVKTITKIVRQDGSVERVVQSSLINEEEAGKAKGKLPPNTSAQLHKKPKAATAPLKQQQQSIGVR